MELDEEGDQYAEYRSKSIAAILPGYPVILACVHG